ncbi:MAG TPA: S8 family serine peptidase [Opitutaceae bacterium]|nr:S8 family serine peptidase [Opitutaceae bacterium]
MSERRSLVIPLAGGCLAVLLLLLGLVLTGRKHDRPTPPADRTTGPTVAGAVGGGTPSLRPAPSAAAATPRPARRDLRQALDQPDARPHEAVLIFADADAYRRFLARAARLGLTVLGQLDSLFAVRVRYDSLAGLEADLVANAADYAEAGANFYINPPTVPAKQDRAAQILVPFGNGMLGFLGATGDRSQWGRGVTIAVLDSGVAPDSTFGQGRLQSLDIGLGTAAGTGPEDGHGTAVAALAAGESPNAPGVAPAADILSLRITDANTQSDIFTVARAILAAVDAGAQIINISLGGYDTSSLLSSAIDYATRRGVVIVASAGNDQATELTWPAADARVVSVGAVDALGQQVNFSNSGPQLQMAAPGYGVQTAWLDGQRVSFDGTSASAPIVAGAIAALMSANPGMSATQAWQTLQQYASDGGAPGPDPDYGDGILNLGWAMNRNDPLRIDTAISSHYYDATSGQMEFVVQNRSGQGVSGLVLNVDAGGVASTTPLPLLGPGATYVVKMPVDQSQLTASGGIVFRTELVNPPGVTDQVPANNRRTSYLSPPPK